MPDGIFVPNISGGLRTLATGLSNIRQQEQQAAAQSELLRFRKQQADIANQRAADQQERRRSMDQWNKAVSKFDMFKAIGATDETLKGLFTNEIQPLLEGSNVDFNIETNFQAAADDTVALNKKMQQWKKEGRSEEEILRLQAAGLTEIGNKYRTPQVKEQLQDVRAQQKELRAFERAKELETFKTEEDIKLATAKAGLAKPEKPVIRTVRDIDPLTGELTDRLVTVKQLPDGTFVQTPVEEPGAPEPEAAPEPAAPVNEAFVGDLRKLEKGKTISVDDFLADIRERNPGLLDAELTESQKEEILELYKKATQKRGKAKKRSIAKEKPTLFTIERKEGLGSPFKKVPETL
jgi:hypothetical protein